MFENEIILGLVVVGWILYELYGRTAFEWLAHYTTYIRIGGGIVVIGYLWWQMREKPTEFKDTLDFAKQLLSQNSIAAAAVSASAGSKEKRNVSNLLKKKIAASQEWKCGTCKKILDETYEVDHRVALFQGGTNEPENLVALCPHCHRLKTVNERLA
jgi:hypothetical protein